MNRRPRAPRRRRTVAPPPLEKFEQAQSVQLLKSLGAAVYVLGTRRKKGDHPGTMQTPGICDVWAFLPVRGGERRQLLAHECKRAKGGRYSEEQLEFRALCDASGTAYVGGGVDALIAWLIAEGFLRADQVAHYRAPALPLQAGERR